jgi:mRNA-degrading endonuclease RelE of RelBE toxin-antitoxin system
MPYTVEVQKRAEKFLRSLKDAALYRRLRAAINSLASDPRAPGSV